MWQPKKHIIDTKLGKFEFGWWTDRWWIYGRFHEPDKAKEVYDCNPYSGKYNFLGFWLGTPMTELRNHLEDMRKQGLLIDSNF